MSAPEFWNPYSQRMETEQVFGGGGIDFFYSNPVGKLFRPALSANPLISKIYGAFQSSALSRPHIESFVETYKISMTDFDPGPYRTFNDFFIRKFREGKRPFASKAFEVPAPCEARYLFFEDIDEHTRVAVKGALLNPIALLDNHPTSKKFVGGSLAIARLCPVDYHRFHFLDDCVVNEQKTISGVLESVNPVAVNQIESLFFKNERALSLLDTKNFGEVAMLEVGALCVGKIVQSYFEGTSEHRRGEEKGYFLFGGSTVILLFEKNTISWNGQYLEKSRQGNETFVRLGDVIGSRV